MSTPPPIEVLPQPPGDTPLNPRRGRAARRTPEDSLLRVERVREEGPADVVGVQRNVRESLDVVLSGKLGEAISQVENRLGLSPEQYHDRIRLDVASPGAEEREAPGRHMFAAHVIPDGKPRPMIFLISGNGDNLRKKPAKEPNLRWGMQHVFEELTGRHPDKFHVVQIRVGQEFAGKRTDLHNEVAIRHARNIMEDALHGRGHFQNCKVSEVRCLGYSYGAGIISKLAAGKQSVVPEGIPLAATAYLDGIRFRSLPPSAIRQAPKTSGRHLHVWQTNPTFWSYFITGAAAKRRPQDTNIHIRGAGIDHRLMVNAQLPVVRDTVYKPVVDFLAA